MSEEQLTNYLAGKPMTFDHITDYEKRDVVEGYCDFVVNKVYLNFIRGADKSEAFVEAKVVVLEEAVYGTSDFVVVREFQGTRDACVVDLKTGFNDVIIPENKQFANYSVGVMRKFGINGKIIAIGYLPRIASREVPYEKWEISQEQLLEWEVKIHSKATKALAILNGTEAPEYTAGDHCTWCPAEGKCVARLTMLNVGAGEDLLTELVDSKAPAETIIPSPQSLTPEQRARLLSVKEEVIAYLGSVESLAIADMQSGTQLPGFKLVLSQTRRGWIKGNEDDIASTLVTRGVKDPWQKKIITIGEVEKKLGKGKIDDLTELSTPSVLIVKESDKRPALAANAAINNLLTDV